MTRAGRAIEVFEGFHDYDARKLETFSAALVIPRLVYVVGRAVSISYRSDKWQKGTFDYIHKIVSFPKVVFAITSAEDGSRPRQLPAKARDGDQVLVRLGKCLDAVYQDDSGEMKTTFPARTDWFFSPPARALYAITAKKKLQCVIWGGNLNVEDRGIVG
ncbi:MAG: hypothetical protein MUQ65_16740 [Armatimonadetes bacterium]|nr:hypothetical protein [Armatimonadota bacterium]